MTIDRLAPMGDEFMKKSKELGHRAELFTAEGQGHGFFNGSAWKKKTTQRTDEFLVSLGYLQKPTAEQADTPIHQEACQHIRWTNRSELTDQRPAGEAAARISLAFP